MLAAKFCQVALAPVTRVSVSRSLLIIKPQSFTRSQTLRLYSNDAKDSVSRLARKKTLRESAMAPAGETAFGLGQGAVAGGAVFALGALCYYGLGLSKESGAIDRAMLWPKHVRQRIKATYMYFGGSVILTAASAAAVFQNPRLIQLVSKNSWVAIGATMAAVIGSGIIVQSMTYKPGFGAKQIAWAAHTAILGAVVAPICFVGGPILIRAAWYTAGVVGGLSAIAACAPSERFLTIGGPLAIGLGVVFASSLGSMFLPPTTALGAGLYSISLYGGLLVFSAFLLYDTQRIVRAAEVYPLNAARPFDPINASISIYLDTLNIFIRIATILAGGGGTRKK